VFLYNHNEMVCAWVRIFVVLVGVRMCRCGCEGDTNVKI